MNYDRGISYQVMEESVVCHDRPIPGHGVPFMSMACD